MAQHATEFDGGFAISSGINRLQSRSDSPIGRRREFRVKLAAVLGFSTELRPPPPVRAAGTSCFTMSDAGKVMRNILAMYVVIKRCI